MLPAAPPRLDLHGSSKVELINARLGRPLHYGPIRKGDKHAAVIGQVTVGDQALACGTQYQHGTSPSDHSE